jgi:hypothetical protein
MRAAQRVRQVMSRAEARLLTDNACAARNLSAAALLCGAELGRPSESD